MLQVQNYQRAYSLYELLLEKYGTGRVEFGLEILAQWFAGNYNGLQSFYYEQLRELMLAPKDSNAPALNEAWATTLRQFFGLKTLDELYNKAAL